MLQIQVKWDMEIVNKWMEDSHGIPVEIQGLKMIFI